MAFLHGRVGVDSLDLDSRNACSRLASRERFGQQFSIPSHQCPSHSDSEVG